LSAPAPAGDSASAAVFVAVPPDEAFRVFTEEIDLWWRQGPRYRAFGKQRGQLNFVGGVGGRVFETFTGERGTHTIEVGRVTAWNPPHSLELEWRASNFKPGEKTFVSVRFEPKRDGTFVTVRQSGWSALPADHPVRHGLEGAEFIRKIALWWREILTALREHVSR
jgi:uncharacterized protein YndB with AHSA1/START domain